MTDVDVCDCSCHRDGSVHVVACCSPCPHCKLNITDYHYERHIERCKKDLALLEAQVDGIVAYHHERHIERCKKDFAPLEASKRIAGAEETALRDALQKATSGPWAWREGNDDRLDCIIETKFRLALSDDTDCASPVMIVSYNGKPSDRELLIAARNAAPVLLAELDRLRHAHSAAQSRLLEILAMCELGGSTGSIAEKLREALRLANRDRFASERDGT